MPYEQQPPVSVQGIPNGMDGVAAIVSEMTKLALGAYRDERISQLARAIVQRCPERDARCEAATLLAYMRETFRYTPLPWTTQDRRFQRLQTPLYTLFDSPTRSGECASLSTALAALAIAVGLQVRWVTCGPQTPSEHVYVLLADQGGSAWWAADPSYDLGLGGEHPEARVKKVWRIA